MTTDETTVDERSPFPSPYVGNGEHPEQRSPYVDLRALLDGDLPEPPAPVLLRRTDGVHVFYAGQVNYLFGDPECGKTHIAAAAVAEALRKGLRVLWVDLDHTGAAAVVTRLLAFGAPVEVLRDSDQLRFTEPEDVDDLAAVIRDVKDGWLPAVAVVDSIGELLPMLGLGSNSPDDFTTAHSRVLKPLSRAGAAVVAVDHLAKNADSRASGPTGTAAKRRAIGGVAIRVTLAEAFRPGVGGSAHLHVNKDRHGGLRRHCPAPDAGARGEQFAGTFVITVDEHNGTHDWLVRAPRDVPERPSLTSNRADLKALAELDPPPKSVRDVKERLHWRTDRATEALRAWRSQRSPSVPREQGNTDASVVPLFPIQGDGNGEHPHGGGS